MVKFKFQTPFKLCQGVSFLHPITHQCIPPLEHHSMYVLGNDPLTIQDTNELSTISRSNPADPFFFRTIDMTPYSDRHSMTSPFSHAMPLSFVSPSQPVHDSFLYLQPSPSLYPPPYPSEAYPLSGSPYGYVESSLEGPFRRSFPPPVQRRTRTDSLAQTAGSSSTAEMQESAEGETERAVGNAGFEARKFPGGQAGNQGTMSHQSAMNQISLNPSLNPSMNHNAMNHNAMNSAMNHPSMNPSINTSMNSAMNHPSMNHPSMNHPSMNHPALNPSLNPAIGYSRSQLLSPSQAQSAPQSLHSALPPPSATSTLSTLSTVSTVTTSSSTPASPHYTPSAAPSNAHGYPMTGSNGPNAVNAVNGPNGPNGPNGLNGVNGTNGFNAVSGVNAVKGINGMNGPNEVNGINGPNGPNGPNGTIALPGINAVGPVNGSSALTGPSGPSGPNGPSGVCGVSVYPLPSTSGSACPSGPSPAPLGALSSSSSSPSPFPSAGLSVRRGRGKKAPHVPSLPFPHPQSGLQETLEIDLAHLDPARRTLMIRNIPNRWALPSRPSNAQLHAGSPAADRERVHPRPLRLLLPPHRLPHAVQPRLLLHQRRRHRHCPRSLSQRSFHRGDSI